VRAELGGRGADHLLEVDVDLLAGGVDRVRPTAKWG
jgi:hypothetical protein